MTTTDHENSIAIIGMSGRFPGASDLESFWKMLCDGREGISDLTESETERWLRNVPGNDQETPVARRPRIHNPTHFDHEFFGYSLAEAAGIDPQQRVFLECAWEALDSAGVDPKQLEGWAGVWAGCDMNTYMLTRKHSALDRLNGTGSIQAMVSNDKDYLATRVAYKLDLKGPAISVQTACSTSLVAVHQACMGLLSGQCDLALAGGASISFPSARGYIHREGDVSSPDGFCRPFDEKSNGTLFGDGVGVVVLKRFQDAVDDQDPILAVIRGIAVNNDGSAKAGYSAPSISGQSIVISTAVAISGIDPTTVGFIEAHGTGTPLGDPIEVEALRRTYGKAEGFDRNCILGSVKGNIGHTSNASGIAGLLKVVLVLKHRRIPPTVHFANASPKLKLEQSTFRINDQLLDWNSPLPRAGISSIGIGGTNAHALLERAPDFSDRNESNQPKAILLSGPSEKGLADWATRVGSFLETEMVDLADTAISLRRRVAMDHRMVATESDTRKLGALLQDKSPGLRHTSRIIASPKPVFLFSGQGCQFPGMAKTLHKEHPVFRRHLELCLDALLERTGKELRQILSSQADGSSLMSDPRYAQPALFCIEYAMAKTWVECGIQPAAILGHSLGELVGASFAGVFELSDALFLASTRGECMGRAPEGAMLSVGLGADELRQLLPADIDLAALNAPGSCLVSGTPESITRFATILEQKEIVCRKLHLNVAGHSRLMESAQDEFRIAFGGIHLRTPSIPILSNANGGWLQPDQATSPDYWVSLLREPVRFVENCRHALDLSGPFIEMGPGRSAASLLRQNAPPDSFIPCIQSLPHAKDDIDDSSLFQHAIGQAWVYGLEPEWSIADPDPSGKSIYLPPRHLDSVVCEMPEIEPGAPSDSIRLDPTAKKPDLDSWLLEPFWKSEPVHTAKSQEGTILLFHAGHLSGPLAEELGNGRATVIAFPDGTDSLPSLARFQEPIRLVSCEALEHWENGTASYERYQKLARWWSLSNIALADRKGEILFLARGSHPLNPADTQPLEKALLRGLVLTANCESPNIPTRLVECLEIDPPRNLHQAASEIHSGHDDELVAIGHGQRWIREIRNTPPKRSSSNIEICKDGVYLLTGGFGGIGMTLAKELARQGASKLVMLGRSPVERHLDKISQLNELGAKVVAHSVDITDKDAIEPLMRRVIGGCGRIDGFIHTAGARGEQILSLFDAETSKRVLESKIEGLRNLEPWIREMHPDFVILCSSLFSMVGGKGLSDYSAANNWLDAWAGKFQCETGTPCISVSWDLWEDVGMAATRKAEWKREIAIPASSWILDEHRLADRPTLPGTAISELILATGTEWLSGPIEIRNLDFRKAASANEDSLLLNVIGSGEQDADLIDVQICQSGIGQELSPPLSCCQISRFDAELEWHLDAWDNSPSSDIITLREIVNQSKAVYWGPRWDCLAEIHREHSRLRARLSLPCEYWPDLEKHSAHPSMVDVATALLGVFTKSSTFLIPVKVERIVFSSSLPKEFQVEVVPDSIDADGSVVGRIRFATLTGVPLGEYRGYTLGKPGTPRNPPPNPRQVPSMQTGISSKEGARLLDKILSRSPATHIGVCVRDFESVRLYHRDRLIQSEPDASMSPDPDAFEGWSEFESQIGKIWCKHLGLRKVGMHDNFFSLGGHSLLAVQIQADIRKSLARDFAISEFFRNPTIGQFADAIRSTTMANSTEFGKAPHLEHHPVSDSQKRLYFLQKLDPDSTQYNNLLAVRIENLVWTESHIKTAFVNLVERHESLRTIFEWVDDEPRQKVLDTEKVELVFLELPEEATDLASLAQPFDLSRSPLVRVWMRTGQNGTMVLLEVHHIVADGLSMEVIVGNMVDLLQEKQLAPPGAGYLDHLHWSLENSKAAGESAVFWKTSLSGELPVLSLPIDHARTSSSRWPGSVHKLDLPAATGAKLKTTLETHGTTAFIALLSGFQAFLGRICGQSDLIVGTPVSGRRHESVSNTVGMFVGTIALRSQPRPDRSFLDFLSETGLSASNAFDHQDYPFESIVRDLAIPRDTTRNPLFDCMFVYQEETLDVVHPAFVRIETGIPQAQCDLCLRAVKSKDGSTSFKFEYRSDLIDAETIARWAESFLVFLDHAFSNPEANLASIPLLDSQSTSHLLVWNATEAEFPTGTILDHFAKSVGGHPDATAAEFPEGSLSYQELDSLSNGLADELSRMGIGTDTLVAVALERGREMPIALWAILKAGAAYLPMDPNYPVDRIRFLLDDSKAKCILAQTRFVEKLQKLADRIPVLDTESNPPSPVSKPPAPDPKAGDLAYCIYTSGSTGRPKGALLEHGSLVNRIHWMQKNYPIGPGDTILQKTPSTFDVSVWEMFWWGMYGAKVAYLEPGGEKDPAAILDAIERHDVTVLHFVPSMLQAFLEYVEAAGCSSRLMKVKQVMASGEALQASHVKAFHRHMGIHGTRLTNLYGPTEATIDVSWYDCDANCPDPVPIGKPIDNTGLHVVDPFGNVQPIGVVGELWITGTGLARGYLNREELTRERFVQAPWNKNLLAYRTGDLARWTNLGQIEYLGRLDFQVKIRGQRIETGEIEEALRAVANVRDAAVVALKTPEGNYELCAYIASSELLREEDITDALALAIPDHMIPSRMMFLESLPLTESGKLDRKSLPAPSWQRKTRQERILPRDEREQAVVAVWESVLNRSDLGIKDNFFEIGGDSIKTIRVVSRLRNAGWRCEVADLFQNPTPEAMARRLEKVRESQATAAPFSLVDVSSSQVKSLLLATPNLDDLYPLTPIQEQVLGQNLSSRRNGADVQEFQSEIDGLLDIDKFRSAWKSTMDRHPVLRSTIFWRKVPRPLQGVFQSPPPPLEFVDLSHLSDSQKHASIEEYRSQVLARGFELQKSLLWRIVVFKMSDLSHRMHWFYFNGLFDAWSANTIKQDLMKYYQLDTQPSPTPDPLPFSMYVGFLQNSAPESSRRFWIDHFHGLAASPQTDHDLRGAKSLESSCIDLDSAASRAIESFCRTLSIPLNPLLQAAWAGAWGGKTESRDVLTSFSSSDRPTELAGIEDMVGLFTQILPVRCQWETESKTGSWLRQFASHLEMVRKHQHASAAQIQSWCPALTNSMRDAVQCRTMVFLNAKDDFDSIQFSGLRFSRFESKGGAPVPLRLYVKPGKKLSMQARYDPQAFSLADIKGLLDSIAHSLEHLPRTDQRIVEWIGSNSPVSRSVIS